MVERAGRQFGELRRQPCSGGIGHVDEEVGVAQLQRLLRHGLGDFLAAIAGIDAPHAADAIKVAAPGGVRHIAAIALNQDERPFLLEAVEMLVGMQDVVAVLLPEFLSVEAVASLVQQDELSLSS